MATRDGGETFVCRYCGLVLLNPGSVRKHEQCCDLNPQRDSRGGGGSKEQKRFTCEVCGLAFTRKYNMKKHAEGHAKRPVQRLLCGLCPSSFRDKAGLLKHRSEVHRAEPHYRYMGGAHRRASELYRMDFPEDIVTVDQCLDHIYERTVPMLEHLLAQKKRMKVSMVLVLKLSKVGGDEEREETMDFHIRSQHLTLMLHGAHSVQQQVEKMCMHVAKQFEDFTQNGSGWVLAECVNVELEIGECVPISGGSGGCYMLHLVKQGRRGNGQKLHQIEQLGEQADSGDQRCFYRALAA